MSDVAKALGVAKGTLYGYVESKDALFDAAVRYADGLEPLPPPDALPIRTPAEGATIDYIRQRVASEAAELALSRVLGDALIIESRHDELSAVLGDLYDRLARHRFTIKLVDRCASEFPELADVWFGQGRWAQHELLCELCRRRVADGSYRPLQDIPVVARTLLETVAFWALHRHFDPSSQDVDDATARAVVIDLLTRAVLRNSP